jgi:hypothetical protein
MLLIMKHTAALDIAKSHLRVALVQALPSDDQIIIGHIRSALEALEGAEGQEVSVQEAVS